MWRQALSLREVAARSALVAKGVLCWTEELPAGLVAGYVALGGEVDPHAILAGLRKRGWAVALPRVEKGTIVMRRHSPGDPLRSGAGGVLEPVAGEAVAAAEVTLALVPGLAYDQTGTRLGRGGGHYDRWLAGCGGPTLGLAYRDQTLKRVPREPHDVRVSHLATESGVMACRPS